MNHCEHVAVVWSHLPRIQWCNICGAVRHRIGPFAESARAFGDRPYFSDWESPAMALLSIRGTLNAIALSKVLYPPEVPL